MVEPDSTIRINVKEKIGTENLRNIVAGIQGSKNLSLFITRVNLSKQPKNAEIGLRSEILEGKNMTISLVKRK